MLQVNSNSKVRLVPAQVAIRYLNQNPSVRASADPPSPGRHASENHLLLPAHTQVPAQPSECRME